MARRDGMVRRCRPRRVGLVPGRLTAGYTRVHEAGVVTSERGRAEEPLQGRGVRRSVRSEASQQWRDG
jgi:hypothetical protein